MLASVLVCCAAPVAGVGVHEGEVAKGAVGCSALLELEVVSVRVVGSGLGPGGQSTDWDGVPDYFVRVRAPSGVVHELGKEQAASGAGSYSQLIELEEALSISVRPGQELVFDVREYDFSWWSTSEGTLRWKVGKLPADGEAVELVLGDARLSVEVRGAAICRDDDDVAEPESLPRCPSHWYGDGECDCECEVPDPDCAWASEGTPTFCAAGQVCAANRCG